MNKEDGYQQWWGFQDIQCRKLTWISKKMGLQDVFRFQTWLLGGRVVCNQKLTWNPENHFFWKGISSTGHASIFGFQMWIIMAQGPDFLLPHYSFGETQKSKIDGHRDRSEQKQIKLLKILIFFDFFCQFSLRETNKNCHQSTHFGILFCDMRHFL